MAKQKVDPKASEQKPAPEEATTPEQQQEPDGPVTRKTVAPLNLMKELYTGETERSFEESSYWPASQIKPYNPDDLVRQTNDYSIYEEMMMDDQVDVCLQIKRDLVIGDGWYMDPQDAEIPENDAIIEDVTRAFEEDADVPIDEIIEEILSAYGYGFSLSEKIFKYRDDNTLTLKNCKTRHPSTWLITTDDHGNVESYEQHGPQKDIELEGKSLVHYVNKRAFGNPYGKSDLRTAYNAWFTKRQITRWYAIFLEKHASPVPIAKYDKNANKTAIDEIHRAIKSLQKSTAMTIPKDIEVEFLESKSNGEAYTKAIHICNMFIGRALMIPDLLGFQGAETGGGSYALGKDQIAILFKHVMRRRTTIERIVNKEFVWPIVVTNHGFVPKFPKFKLRPISEEHLLESVKVWNEVVKGKLYKPSDEEINHFRGIVKFPQGDVEREAPPPVMGFGPDGEPLPPPQGGADGSTTDDKGKTEEQPAKAGEGKKEAPALQEKGSEKEVPKQFAFKALPGGYDKKVDYAALGASMDRFRGRVVDEALPVVRRLFEDLYEQIKVKKILQTQDAERMESLKLKSPRDLNLILKRALREGYREGQVTGQRELLKGNFRTPLADDKFLEFLDAETFQYVGDWSYNVTKRARIAILEAIRDGKPISAVIDILDAEGLTDSMTSLERYARTKFTDVMNRGRIAAFQESGVVAAYQYSAILDDRTSEICAGLHGKIFKSGTEPVPPMHFNCRSLLIPITRYESFETDDEVGGQAITEFIEQNKGDGFAKR